MEWELEDGKFEAGYMKGIYVINEDAITFTITHIQGDKMNTMLEGIYNILEDVDQTFDSDWYSADNTLSTLEEFFEAIKEDLETDFENIDFDQLGDEFRDCKSADELIAAVMEKFEFLFEPQVYEFEITDEDAFTITMDGNTTTFTRKE